MRCLLRFCLLMATTILPLRGVDLAGMTWREAGAGGDLLDAPVLAVTAHRVSWWCDAHALLAGYPQAITGTDAALVIDLTGPAGHLHATGSREQLRVDWQPKGGAARQLVLVPILSRDQARNLAASAHESYLQHRAREALPILDRVLSQDRFDLAVSLPALHDLIGCYQQLAADPAIAARYRAWSSCWLSHPPPLDGVSEPGEAQAREDLLWRPHGAINSACVTGMTRDRTLENGQRHVRLQIQVALVELPGQELYPPDGQRMAFEALEVSAELASGQSLPISLMPSWWMGPSLCVTVDDPPANCHLLRHIHCKVRAQQRIGVGTVTRALERGVRWTTAQGDWSIQSVSGQQADHQWRVVLTPPAGPTIASDTHTAVAVSASAATSSSGINGDPDSPIWLIGPSRHPFYPIEITETDATGIILTFHCDEPPNALVARTAAGQSDGIIAVDIDHIDIP